MTHPLHLTLCLDSFDPLVVACNLVFYVKHFDHAQWVTYISVFCVHSPAGMAFYSISDIADRLFSTPAHPMPSLEEGYWLSRCTADASSLLYTLLEELSPAAMAAFDLACCHCQLWKTSRQLLDTAERRLHSSLEARGMQYEFWVFFLMNRRGDIDETLCLSIALHI